MRYVIKPLEGHDDLIREELQAWAERGMCRYEVVPEGDRVSKAAAVEDRPDHPRKKGRVQRLNGKFMYQIIADAAKEKPSKELSNKEVKRILRNHGGNLNSLWSTKHSIVTHGLGEHTNDGVKVF